MLLSNLSPRCSPLSESGQPPWPPSSPSCFASSNCVSTPARGTLQRRASRSTRTWHKICFRHDIGGCMDADGVRRMPCRMHLTHAVGVRNFINACVYLQAILTTEAHTLTACSSRPENMTRAYTIGTGFPNRTLDNDTQSIEDAGLRNSLIMQRWV
jgi:hypothetical protein